MILKNKNIAFQGWAAKYLEATKNVNKLQQDREC